MKKIIRIRYVITRNKRSEIFCGNPKNYHFKKMDVLENATVRTYADIRKAEQALICWKGYDHKDNYEILPVEEKIMFI